MTVTRRKNSGMSAATNGDPSQVFNAADASTGSEVVNLAQIQADFAALAGLDTQTFDVAPGTGTQAIQTQQAQADFAPISLAAPVPVDRIAALDALATAYLNPGPNTWTDYLVVGAAATTATDVSMNGVVVASLLAPSSGMSVITPPGSTLQLDTTLPGTWLRVTS